MQTDPAGIRYDLSIIASWITPGSRILGLGCGDGELLHYLKKHRQTRETGIEIVESRVAACIEKGLSVIQGDISEEIADYADNTFDCVILSQTLQQVYSPRELILNMLRIGRRSIVSFPNFGHWPVRMQLLLRGRAPVTPQLPYEWYDTPNIRVLSIRDFREFAARVGFRIYKEAAINTDQRDKTGNYITFLPNLRATYGIFLIGR
jgi:methionine biosynthesis protein MetW